MRDNAGLLLAASSAQHDALYDYSQKLAERIADMEATLAAVQDERDVLRAENEAIGEHVFGLQKENGMLHDIGWNSFMEKAQISKLANHIR